MLRSNSKSLGNHVVSPEEEAEGLQWEGLAEKEGFQVLLTSTTTAAATTTTILNSLSLLS